jgi:hypothetical protein
MDIALVHRTTSWIGLLAESVQDEGQQGAQNHERQDPAAEAFKLHGLAIVLRPASVIQTAAAGTPLSRTVG